ncbi:MAG: PLP-dependent transferase [Spirochaetes bacterium]|nr:MAG: PLP-dependent transferase [Spirochaetota bacterium]
MDIRTTIAHAGLCADESNGAISTPIHQTATFRHPGPGCFSGYDYTRTANPTRAELERVMADIEGGKGGFAFASGMAAITAVMALFGQGAHILFSDDLYGGTWRLFEGIAPRFGITASYADMSHPSTVESHFREETRAVFIETPSNPMLKIVDIAAVAAIAKRRGVPCIVDNTFMTPYLQNPLALGADIVVHSGTKYLGGHNDTLCGIAVAATDDLCARLAYIQNATGGVLSPMDSWLLLRGLKTLAIRLDRAQESAAKIAEWCALRADITGVWYPGLPGHPGRAVQEKQARGFGAMLSFRVKDRDAANRVLHGVRIISYAESLGGVESLITHPATQTHADIPLDIRERLGITDTLLRLSVGIEAVDDLIEDLDQALANA